MAASPPQIASFLSSDDYTPTIREQLKAFVEEAQAEGVTGLYKAIKLKRLDFAHLLIHSPDANVHYTFFLALQKEDFDLATVLLTEYQADINWVDEGWTLLQNAPKKLPLSAWRFLLRNKADTVIPESQNSILHLLIALHYTSVSEEQKIARIKILLEEYPDMIHHKNNEGVTPLHLAYAYQYWEIIPLLLEQGADANAADCYGRIPADYMPQYSIQNFLIDYCMPAMGFAVNKDGMCLGFSFAFMQAFFFEYYYPDSDHPKIHERFHTLFYDFILPALKKYGSPPMIMRTEAEDQAVMAEIRRLFAELQQEHPSIYADIKDFFHKVCIWQDPSAYAYLCEPTKKPYAQKDVLLTLPVTESQSIKELGGTKRITQYIEIYNSEKLVTSLAALRQIAITAKSPLGLMLKNDGHNIFLGFDPIKRTWWLRARYCSPLQTISAIEESSDSIVAKKIEEELKDKSYMIFAVEIYGVGQNYDQLCSALEASHLRSSLECNSIADLCPNDRLESIITLWRFVATLDHGSIASKLLNEGYDPNIACTDKGHTVLSVALAHNSLETLGVLLASGQINWYMLLEGKTLLHYFVAYGSGSAVLALLQHISHDPNLLYFMHFSSEVTPLELAIQKGDHETVRILLDNLNFCAVVFRQEASWVTGYFDRALRCYESAVSRDGAKWVSGYTHKVLEHYQPSEDRMNALKIVKLILSHPNVPITSDWVEANKYVWRNVWRNLPSELQQGIEGIVMMRFPSSTYALTLYGFFAARNENKAAPDTENIASFNIRQK